MFRMRKEQLGAIHKDHQEEKLKALCAHLFTYFPEQTLQFTKQDLCLKVEDGIQQANQYGLYSSKDIYSFVSITAQFGWEFYKEADFRWMREILEDDFVENPSERIALLMDRCLNQLDIDAHNKALRQQFQPAENNAFEHTYKETQWQEEMPDQRLLTGNRLKPEQSTALTSTDYMFPEAKDNSERHLHWVDDVAPLILDK